LSERRSLRLRLLAIVVAATLVPLAPLAIVLLLQARNALYGRAFADARARLADVRRQCAGERCPEIAGFRRTAEPCAARNSRV
jgi:hypothetical protein